MHRDYYTVLQSENGKTRLWRDWKPTHLIPDSKLFIDEVPSFCKNMFVLTEKSIKCGSHNVVFIQMEKALFKKKFQAWWIKAI